MIKALMVTKWTCYCKKLQVTHCWKIQMIKDLKLYSYTTLFIISNAYIFFIKKKIVNVCLQINFLGIFNNLIFLVYKFKSYIIKYIRFYNTKLLLLLWFLNIPVRNKKLNQNISRHFVLCSVFKIQQLNQNFTALKGK